MNHIYKIAILGQVMHEESPKNQTAIPSKSSPLLPHTSGAQQLLLPENINKKILTNTEMDIKKY